MISLMVMHLLGINANIMSLGGLALAIGVMIDSSMVMVENAHKHLEREKERIARGERPRPHVEVILEAAREVGPTLFFSLLIITVSFLPIFVLGEQSGRMFKPLAYTKTFAMAASSLLAVTIIPVLMTYFISSRVLPREWGWKTNLLTTLAAMFVPAGLILLVPLPAELAWASEYRHWIALGWAVLMGMLLVPQRIIHEHASPMSWILQRAYEPFFVIAMRWRWLVMIGAVAVVAVTVWPLQRLGSEFMPPLEEGDLLYMPTSDPGISITKVRELLQQTDKMIMQFPEVQSVMGKSGWAETATDPAPISMFETTIMLRRDKHDWRHVPFRRFYSNWPDWLAWLPGKIWEDTRPITVDELIHGYEWPDGRHIPGLNEVVQIPGLTNAWTMPIKTRVDMLSTGIKTPVGVKVMGPDLATLAQITDQVTQVLKTAEGTGAYTVSAFAEKSIGGNYLDIRLERDQIARYGLLVDDVQEVINTAMGGMMATQTVEGLERYSVNLRYPPELRDNLPALKQVLVGTPSGAQVPLGQLASFEIRKGPPEVKSENARRTSWVFVDIAGIDVGTYVKNAQQAVARQVSLPAGYNIVWSGQYEYMLAARAKLMVAIPLTFVLIVLLLYASMKSWPRVLLVLLAVPFSLVGAIWILFLLDYNLSLAVWVGIIALAGLDAETGMVMLLYLDNSFERFRKEGRMRDVHDLWYAVHDGAVKRIRPKTMTVTTTFIGLVPLLWATGAGADTMRRLAAPMIGGLATSFIMELLLYPVIFYTAKRLVLRKHFRESAVADVTTLPTDGASIPG
jgi:Cu(I)/Ag(I) efflux system membrane protein CusA/SilA